MKKTNTINILSIVILLFATDSLQAQKIAAGGWHSLTVCYDSTVKAFGENATGQLGDGSTTDRSIPVSVKNLSKVVAVSAGGDQLEAHSMALKSDGTVWAWGSNLYGALGDGTTVSTTEPVQSLLLSDVIAISAGGWHSVALKSDSTVWVWGWNTDGQVGDGTTTDRTFATKVKGLSGVIAIAAGTYHVIALKADGTVWAWGDNISGQIGDGTTTDRSMAVQVSNLSNVVKIACGRFFSLAVKSDGTVWTWGENLYGQLGNGNNNNSSVPVQVSGLSGITSAITASGAFHCIALKNDSTVWAWGRNTYGNLGDGTTTHSNIPVLVTGVKQAAEFAAGTNFTLMYTGDGSFWGCGRNTSGQLGDGTVLQRNTFVKSTYVCPLVQPSAIENNTIVELVQVFPNPSVSGIFKLDFQSTSIHGVQLEVYNAQGQLVFSSNSVEDEMQIDLSAVSQGVYFLHVLEGNKRYYQTLIKQ